MVNDPLRKGVLLDRPEVRILSKPFPLLDVLGPQTIFDIFVCDARKLL